MQTHPTPTRGLLIRMYWIVPVVVIIVCVVAVVLALDDHSARVHGQSREAEAELFLEVRDLIVSRYVTEVDSTEILYGALEGMTRSLDQHSVFEDPDAYRNFRKSTDGIIQGGIGVRIRGGDKGVEIMSVLRNSPARRAGVEKNDRLVAIDGEDVSGLDSRAISQRLGGEVGTKVKLGLLREESGADEPRSLTIEVQRANIELESVTQVGLVGNSVEVGYLRLSGFQDDSPDEVATAISLLRAAGATSLLLDLRGNPGGRMVAATRIADFFLSHGVIVTTHGRNIAPRQVSAAEADTLPDLPLIVLVDSESASASEVLSGALQDHHRALVVGSRTWGKGSVQEIFPLADDTMALKLTTKRYLTPNGRSLHRELDNASWGIVPDVLVELSDEEREAMSQAWIEAEIVREDGAVAPMVPPHLDRQLLAALDSLAEKPISVEAKTLR